MLQSFEMNHHSFESLIRDVGERLHGSCKSQWAAAVVDPFVRDPFDDEFIGERGAIKLRIDVPLRDKESSRFPYLLLLEGTSGGVGLLHATVHEAMEEQRAPDREADNGFAIGPWITFDSDPDEVVRHWSRICTTRFAGQGRKYLRLADRRVLKWLWRRLDADQKKFLAGPMTQIVVLGRDLRMTDLHVPAETRCEAIEPSWNFDQAMLEECEAAQAMLRGWQRFATSFPGNYVELADFVLSEARSAGAEGLHDQVLLGAYALQVDNYILRSPELRDLIAASQMQALNLALALSEIPDSRWDAMALSMRQGRSDARNLETTHGERKHGFR